jgi:hypothetical protein
LLALAFLALVGSVTHFINNGPAYGPLPYENDQMLTMGLISVTSGLLATFLSTLLESPTRQIIFVGGGMITFLSVFVWLLTAR